MQPDEPDKNGTAPTKPGRGLGWAIFRSVSGAFVLIAVLGAIMGVFVALFHPETPVPPEWNPTVPLVVADPTTLITPWKLRRALGDPVQCIAALQAASQTAVMTPLIASEHCHIRNRVSVAAIGSMVIDDVQTSCATALRMAMWERHGIQPAAREILGTQTTVIRQIGSYSCRAIRTTAGSSTRWSTHARADAIDISGFEFADGRSVRLIDDWDGNALKAQFLHAVRDSACTWFATTLSPDYNSLHADHFHLQARGWGSCR